MKQNDTEIEQYKNIISNKLRPQLQKLLEENNRLRSDKDAIVEESDSKQPKYVEKGLEGELERQRAKTLGLKQEIGKLKGENKFMRDRIECLQRQLESYIDCSPQIYLNEIKRLKHELSKNQADI